MEMPPSRGGQSQARLIQTNDTILLETNITRQNEGVGADDTNVNHLGRGVERKESDSPRWAPAHTTEGRQLGLGCHLRQGPEWLSGGVFLSLPDLRE